jgi:hypothetical protein
MPKERTEVEILNDFLEGINCAIGGVSQLVHARINPKFIGIRDMLQIILDRTKKMLKEKGNL